MDLKAIKDLAQAYSVEELSACADALEQTGTCKCTLKSDASDAMSDVLQALEVRGMLDKGMSLPEAVREFSKRVRTALS